MSTREYLAAALTHHYTPFQAAYAADEIMKRHRSEVLKEAADEADAQADRMVDRLTANALRGLGGELRRRAGEAP